MEYVEEKVGTRLCGLREFREAQTLRVELPSYSNSCNTLLVILASKWCSIYLGSTVDTPHVFPAPSIEMDLRFFFLTHSTNFHFFQGASP